MCQSLRIRVAALVLVGAMAAPAFAAPKRDDSPFERFGKTISSVIERVIQILDLSQISPPK